MREIKNVQSITKMIILRNTIFFLVLIVILGLLYFNADVLNVVTISPRHRPYMHIYHNSSDRHSSDVEYEIPNVIFEGINIRFMR